MSNWLKVKYKNNNLENEIKTNKGIMYQEVPSLLKKETKEIRIVYKDEELGKKRKHR